MIRQTATFVAASFIASAAVASDVFQPLGPPGVGEVSAISGDTKRLFSFDYQANPASFGIFIDGLWSLSTPGVLDRPIPRAANGDGSQVVGIQVNLNPAKNVAWRYNRQGLRKMASRPGEDMFVEAISADGHRVVGGHQEATRTLPCQWRDGILTDLPLPSGFPSAMATGITALGDTAFGRATDPSRPNQSAAVVWRGSETFVLPTLGGMNSTTIGTATDGGKLFFGYSETSPDSNESPTRVLFESDGTSIKDVISPCEFTRNAMFGKTNRDGSRVFGGYFPFRAGGAGGGTIRPQGRPFVFDRIASRVYDLQALLEYRGLSEALRGWTLLSGVPDFSGEWIVGDAINPSGVRELYRAKLEGFPTAPILASLAVDAVYGVNSETMKGHLQISAPAPTGGLRVPIATSSPNIQLPKSVLIQAGRTTADFVVTPLTRIAADPVRVEATLAGARASAEFAFLPFKFNRLQAISRPIHSGANVEFTLQWASIGVPVSVSLTSSNPAVLPVSDVLLEPNKGELRFLSVAGTVTRATQVLITARYKGKTVSTKVTVYP